MDDITLNAHPEKWANLLTEARDRLAEGKDAYIPVTNGEGEEAEIRLVADSAEFGLEDKPYMDDDD